MSKSTKVCYNKNSLIFNKKNIESIINSTLSQLPKISIITPSFNQGRFLEKTILSVLNQKYLNLEYIIIDGGSTDNSINIIKKYETELAYWISEKDNGQSEAINKGLERCTGDIVAWLNSDDFYEPDTFKHVLKGFKDNPNAGLIYGDCRMILVDKNLVELGTRIVVPGKLSIESLLSYWKSYFLPPQPSMFWLRSVQDKTNLLSRDFNYAMDMHFWLQLGNYTAFAKVDALLSNYLIHTQSKSGSVGGFSKFRAEWKKVAHLYVSKKSLVFRLNYKVREILATYNISSKSKGWRLSIIGVAVRLLKKVTGIKEFGILKK